MRGRSAPLLKILLFLAAACLIALPMFAQSTATSANIRGKVVNQNGTPISGAEINAVGTQTGFVRTVNARSDGSYTLSGLTPGTYNIVVAAPGFEPQTQTVTVLLGQTLENNLRLTGNAVLSESITVVGTQAVETKTPEVATNVTTQQIESLPQDDRNFLNFAALAPGVRLSHDPQRKTFAGDAQDAEQTNIFIDGVSTKNDVLQGGTSGQDSSRGNPFPQSAVQEFRVITQNYSAQYDHASSAIITAITKSGGNNFTGQAFAFYQPHRWVSSLPKSFGGASAVPLAVNNDYRRVQPGISIGGPILKDTLNFFATYEGDDEHAATPVTVVIPQFASQFSSLTGTFASPFKSNLGFGKLSWMAEKNQLVDVSANYRREHEIRDFGGQTSFESATNLRNWVYGGTVRHQWNSNSALNEGLVSYSDYGWNPTPLNPGLVGRRFFTPNFTTVFRTGGGTTLQDFDQRRLELRDNFSFAPMTLGGTGTHNFQVGGNYDRMRYSINKSLNGNPEFKFLPDANGVFPSIPFEADFGIGNPILKTNNNEYGVYGQDNWAVNNHLSMNLGLRWDYESQMMNTNYVTPAFIVSALKGKTFTFDGRQITIPDQYFSTGTERKPFKDEFQPRFGFTYDLFENSKSVVFGGWGKYYDRLFLNSTLDERFRLQFPVYRFEFSPDGRPGTVKFDPSFFTIPGLQQLVAQGAAHPEIYLLSNNTKPPYSTQYNVGFRQTFGSWLGSVSYDAVRGKRGITFVSASGTCCAAFVPGFGNIIINDPVGKSFWYDAGSLTLERPFTNQSVWGARFIYTHARALQNGNDLFSLDLPAAGLYARHPVAGSEPNRFVASAIVRVPFDIRLSSNVTLSTGAATPFFNFSQGFDLPGRLKTGVLSGAVYPPKSGGFGFRDVDFRAEKTFGSFHGGSIGVIGEVFNAFNYSNLGCLSSFAGSVADLATLGQPSCVITLGRREQLGLRFNF